METEMEMELQTRKAIAHIVAHDFHDVESIEDLKIEGEEGVLCPVCEELLSGPGFKCSECPFLCHKSCRFLKYEIEHPLHPEQSLELQLPVRYAYCDACGKCCQRCFSYSCTKCSFRLDTKCVSRWRVKKDTCEPHAFVPLVEQIQFTCNFCGEEGRDNGCLCSLCLLTIHSKCAPFLRTIKIANHPHSLKFRYSTHEVEKQEVEEHEEQEKEEQEVEKQKVEEKEEQEIGEQKDEGDIECKLCFDKLNTKYASYYCRECKYVAHLRCASDREVMEQGNEIFGTLRMENHGYFTRLIKDKNQAVIKSSLAGTINHFSHQQHELILDSGDVANNKVCDGCMQPISIPFYSCVLCNFFLHSLCANLPTKATSGVTFLSFNLLPLDKIFQCNACKQWRHGFAYKFESNLGNYEADIQCFMLQEKVLHDLHQHPLFLGRTSATCNCCDKRRAYHSCFACNFSLCQRCATLPSEVQCKFDRHPLKLTSNIEDDSGEYYCLICEKERDPKYWLYYCAKCDFTAHRKCVVGKYSYIKFGKTYKDGHHQHPFTFVQKIENSPPCDACGEDFEGMALHCKECNINVHPYFDNLYCRDHLKKFNNFLNKD